MDWWQYRVTQGFGPTNEPLDSGWGGYDHFNKGIDFGVPAGTPVRSVVSGTVISAGDSADGWGTSVKIRDANGTYFDPYQFIAQAPGASPPMEDPLVDQYTGGGTTTQPRAVGRTAQELIAAGGVQQGLDAIVHAGTLYNLRDDGKFYAGYTELRPPNTADDTMVFRPEDIASLPGYKSHQQIGPNLAVTYADGSTQYFSQKAGGWTPVGSPKAVDPSTRFVTIPSSASPNAPTTFGGAPPSGQPKPNEWDAIGTFNAVTQGGAGQRFTQTLPSGHLTPQHSQLVGAVANNQLGNNEMILRSYGIDTSKAEWLDPVAVAVAAATLGARQKGLVDQGYDPTMAASLIQYENENKAGISNPLSQQGMSNPYSGGQQVIVGPDGHTYSAAAYQQAFG